MRLRVLSWSLGPGHERWQDLAGALAGWEWDVALLRQLPARWPVPVATALDAEFRCAPRPGGSGSLLRRLLPPRGSPQPEPGAGLILARRDRLVAQWPSDPARAESVGVHAARLACGIWVGNLSEPETGARSGPALLALAADEAVVLAGDRPALTGALAGLEPVARAGREQLWSTPDLVAVTPATMLANGALGAHPPLAITLERRP